MKYEHPTIKIDSPAPGHYVISGHAPKSVFIEDEGHVVPPRECYITPEVPDEALQAVLDARAAVRGEESAPKRGRGRPKKEKLPVEPEKVAAGTQTEDFE